MRPYRVICHMETSLDGKINGNYLEIPNADYFTKQYEALHQTFNSKAWICGRVTFEQHITYGKQIDLSQYPNRLVSRKDFVANTIASAYAIAIDPSGKLGWEQGIISEDYEERHGQHIITVLSENVSNQYLEHLQAIGVSYIFAGKSNQLDLRLALNKISQIYEIDQFMLEGGGYLNGSFLSAGLVDELSLILAPMVEGCSSNALSLFEYGDNRNQPVVEFTLDKIEPLDNSGLWLRYKVKH